MLSQTAYPTAAADFGIGRPWDDIANALTEGDGYATNILNSSTLPATLSVTGFNFTIPANATVLGLMMEFSRFSSFVPRKPGDWPSPEAHYPFDETVYLTYNGEEFGENKERPSESFNWVFEPEVVPYGGESDTWGLDLTPALVNDPSFGVNIDLAGDAEYGSIGHIDFVRLTVYYEPLTYEEVGVDGVAVGGVALDLLNGEAPHWGGSVAGGDSPAFVVRNEVGTVPLTVGGDGLAGFYREEFGDGGATIGGNNFAGFQYAEAGSGGVVTGVGNITGLTSFYDTADDELTGGCRLGGTAHVQSCVDARVFPCGVNHTGVKCSKITFVRPPRHIKGGAYLPAVTVCRQNFKKVRQDESHTFRRSGTACPRDNNASS